MSFIDKWRNANSKNGAKGNKERIVQQMCDDYLYYLNNAPNSATIGNYYDDSVNELCTIIDVNVENSYGDEKYITTLPNAKIDVGDLIYFKDSLSYSKDLCWIVRLREDNAVPSHLKFRITPCRDILKIRTKDDIVSIPSYFTLTTSRMNNYSNDVKFKLSQPINYSVSDMITYMGAENAKKYVYEGMRYLLPHNGKAKAYKINFIDCTKQKLVVIQAEETPLVAEDDIENLIAFNGEALENDDIESKNNYNLVGLDSIEKESVYFVENANNVKFSLDDYTLASIEILSSNKCKIIGLKSKEYVRLFAKIDDITLTKDILIRRV